MRCNAGPPSERVLRRGAWSFTLHDRVLEVEGPARPLRIAALSAAGFGAAPSGETLAGVRDAQADFAILLGGLGDDPAAAALALRILAGLPVPCLIVSGGRDTWAARAKALHGLPETTGIIDGTGLQAIRIARTTFVPISGAEGGRYAHEPGACGFDGAELDRRAAELGARKPGESRWLLSWHAPARVAGALGPRSSGGLLLGSAALARFAQRIGARGGLYAWPSDELEVERSGPMQLAEVPRGFGPRRESASGVLSPNGVLLLEVGPDGVPVVL